MSDLLKIFLFICMTSIICACSDEQQPMEIAVAAQTITVCSNPRPEMCTMEYRPVCATQDTGIRCVTEPCDSTETATYSNGCSACSDPKVLSYIPGECQR